MSEQEIIQLIKDDPWMMEVLSVAASADLPDWMIGAGFVRNKVWDYLHGYKNKEVQTADIDLIYYDESYVLEEKEKELDKHLREKLNINWSAKNQARMHVKHKRINPYKNTEEALSEWVETPTCIAVRLEKDGTLTLFAPHGIKDLINLIVRPTPTFSNDLETFWGRVKSKDWERKWPKLTITTSI